MVYSVETPSDTAQVEAPEKPSRKVVRVGLSVATRLARVFYAFLSVALAAGVLFQVFFAGMGAFGADWSYHVILIGAQYALAHAVVPAAALHPVNGFLILLTSLFIARRAWAVVRRKG